MPDLQKLSAAYDLPYFRIKTLDDLALVEHVWQEKSPALCEVFVDRECFVSPRSATQVLPDGSMRSSPLENQFPFLPDDEAARNIVR